MLSTNFIARYWGSPQTAVLWWLSTTSWMVTSGKQKWWQSQWPWEWLWWQWRVLVSLFSNICEAVIHVPAPFVTLIFTYSYVRKVPSLLSQQGFVPKVPHDQQQLFLDSHLCLMAMRSISATMWNQQWSLLEIIVPLLPIPPLLHHLHHLTVLHSLLLPVLKLLAQSLNTVIMWLRLWWHCYHHHLLSVQTLWLAWQHLQWTILLYLLLCLLHHLRSLDPKVTNLATMKAGQRQHCARLCVGMKDIWGLSTCVQMKIHSQVGLKRSGISDLRAMNNQSSLATKCSNL